MLARDAVIPTALKGKAKICQDVADKLKDIWEKLKDIDINILLENGRKNAAEKLHDEIEEEARLVAADNNPDSDADVEDIDAAQEDEEFEDDLPLKGGLSFTLRTLHLSQKNLISECSS